ncbi:GNAT family N-acetyltransferase [Streptomyces cyaneochromogenes]|uniref:GNAT family N-acetyltransferase n=1 Tax=Streptomyces cyaneochromogenes TaxID=2496836 RepID=A0A3S9MLI4_9ACTN|nr:GNAT family N-acetyltransferase [Streptomyces cyaneochromogenes]AZQ40054.1 GNAT family N-acetyltransferase [Streptomyces cyaneochromogenes]
MSDQQHEVIVRPARAADLGGLVACSSALFAEDAGKRDPSVNVGWPREFGPERFAAGIDDPFRVLLVADCGGQVVGHLAGAVAEGSAMRPARVATLVSMYVQPDHRRGGLGARLVGQFTAWAKEVGAEQAEVTAYSSNADAIRFYERNGFASQSVTLRTSL